MIQAQKFMKKIITLLFLSTIILIKNINCFCIDWDREGQYYTSMYGRAKQNRKLAALDFIEKYKDLPMPLQESYAILKNLCYENDHADLAEILLKKGVMPECRIKQGHLLRRALVHKNPDILELILTYGVDANLTTSLCSTPIACAVKDTKTELVKILLDHGANPNKSINNDPTPIIIAIEQLRIYKNLQSSALTNNAIQDIILIIKMLLQHKANPFIKINNTKSAISLAIEYNFQDIIILINKHASLKMLTSAYIKNNKNKFNRKSLEKLPQELKEIIC